MEDSYIIANFHALCRLCLNKSSFGTSIFGAAPDDETNISITSKIAECVELRVSIYLDNTFLISVVPRIYSLITIFFDRLTLMMDYLEGSVTNVYLK